MNLKTRKIRFRGPKTGAIALFLCLFATVLLFSCKKSDSNPSAGSKFKPADFKVTNIVTQVESNGVWVNYEEQNTTSMDYNYDNDGAFRIKWTVKTTDGVQYQEDRLLATELDAGAAAALSCYISTTQGKTIDVSTLNYVVYYNN